MLRPGKIVVLALALLGLRVVLAVSQWSGTGASLTSSVIEVGLGVLAALACLKARSRSGHLGRQFWTLSLMAFVVWTTAEVFVVYVDTLRGLPMAVWWPSAIFFFLFAVPLAMTVLLDESLPVSGIDWQQTLDFAQIGIVAVSLFFLVFYIPSLVETSSAALAGQAMKLHIVRDALLAAGLGVRSLFGLSPAARSMYRRMAIFFTCYGGAAAVYFYGRGHWTPTVVNSLDLLPDATLVLLIALTDSWKETTEQARAQAVQAHRATHGSWAQFLPLLLPLLALALAARMSQQQPATAWTIAVASLGCVGARIAVTQYRQETATAALRESESKYRDLVENIAEVFYSTDREGRISYVSPAAEQVLGYKPEQLLGSSALEHIHPDEVAEARAELQGLLRGTRGRGEWRILTKTGLVRWVRSSSRPLVKDGQVIGISGVLMDVTEEKNLEERFLKAFHSSPIAMTISRLEDGCYLDVNDCWLRELDFKREEVIGRTSVELGIWSREERARFAEALEHQSSVHNLETTFLARGGRPFIGLLSSEFVEINAEACILSAIQDVTELRRAEEQLRQSQKMEAIGNLSAAIAHDFNNLLTVVQGYSQILRDRVGPAGPGAAEASHIQEAAERGAALTRQLLIFSRKQLLHPQVLQLNSVVLNMQKMLAPLLGGKVRLVTACASDLGKIKADPAQLEQVILNLAINARDAMPEGGRLRFETRNVQLDEEFVRLNPGASQGEFAMLAVQDEGRGMDAATMQRIFEPFFTTKEAGKGTGLGLSTAYGIVRQSGGYISVQSEVGKGTTFRIYLPRVDQPAADPRPSASSLTQPAPGR